jgi:GlcNAc-P-P-Und epimerase
MKKKITVIGGAGFIGTNLCHLLTLNQQDFEIIDLKVSHQFPNKCQIGDVRDINSLRKTITGGIIVNLAAVHRDDVRNKEEYRLTNVNGADNIVTVCSEKKISKIIFTSSVAVYGFAKPGTDENGKINPFNEYGRTKFEAENKLRAWQEESDNSLLIVRPTVVFGEGNRGNVFNLLRQISSGKFFMVGNGKNKKSIAYIGNLVAFLYVCINCDRSFGIFNYVDTPNLTMNELVEQVSKTLKNKDGVGMRVPYWLGMLIGVIADIIAKFSGQVLPVSSLRVKKFISSTEFVSSKKNLDNFIPPFALAEGIKRTLQSEFISPDPAREIFYTE